MLVELSEKEENYKKSRKNYKWLPKNVADSYQKSKKRLIFDAEC